MIHLSRSRTAPAHITDAQISETACLAASGRRIPDFIIRAIARRIEAEDASDRPIDRPTPRNWLLEDRPTLEPAGRNRRPQ